MLVIVYMMALVGKMLELSLIKVQMDVVQLLVAMLLVLLVQYILELCLVQLQKIVELLAALLL